MPLPQQCIRFPTGYGRDVFFRILFIETEGQSGGETRRVPRGPPRPHTRGKASARRPRTRFRRRPRAHGRFFNRNSTSGARALVFLRRAAASRHSGATRNIGFSKMAFRLLLWRRAHDATMALFRKSSARKRPRGANFSFSRLATFPASLLFTRHVFFFSGGAVERKLVSLNLY